MFRLWLVRIISLLMALVFMAVPVFAATSVDISITATPMVSNGITGFTITYITDTQLDFDWGYSGDATKIMIRAKYGGYPADIPNDSTTPSDGYLVYYGNAVSASDTNVDFNNSTLQVYYKAWGQKADGTWYVTTSTGYEESRNVIFIGLLIFALAATFISLRWYNILLSLVGMLGWIILWAYNLNNPLSGVTKGSFVHEAMTYAFVALAIVVMLVFFRNRGKAKGMFNTNTESEGVAPDADTTLRGRGMMDLSNAEYKQYIRLKMRNKRR